MKKPPIAVLVPLPVPDNEVDSVNDVMLLPEAAAFLRCDPKTILKMAKAGQIPFRRTGTGWRFSRKAFTKWMQDEGNDHTSDVA